MVPTSGAALATSNPALIEFCEHEECLYFILFPSFPSFLQLRSYTDDYISVYFFSQFNYRLSSTWSPANGESTITTKTTSCWPISWCP